MACGSRVSVVVISWSAIALLAACSNEEPAAPRDVPGLGAGFGASPAVAGSAGLFVPTAGAAAATAPTGGQPVGGIAAPVSGTGGTAGALGGAGGAAGMQIGGVGATGGSAGLGGMGGTTTGGSGAVGGSGGLGGTGAAGGTGGTGGTGGMATGGTGGGGNPDDPYDAARQACVEHINMYRATLGLSPLMRATPEQEACSDMGAETDAAVYEATGQGHTSSGSCPGLGGQNTCPSWPVFGSIDSTVLRCLDNMWDEGPPPGTVQQCIADRTGCFLMHGHWINMSNADYRVVACGFYELPDGRLYMNQDYGF